MEKKKKIKKKNNQAPDTMTISITMKPNSIKIILGN